MFIDGFLHCPAKSDTYEYNNIKYCCENSMCFEIFAPDPDYYLAVVVHQESEGLNSFLQQCD